MLEAALNPDDAQAWKPGWESSDQQGHGTELAGLALFGPLEGLLLDDSTVVLAHRLESVKILPDDGENEPPDYGPITVGSMTMAELQAPGRPRTFCLSITADDRDQGLPTLWSAAIDQAAAGAEDGIRRLVVVSAGNMRSDIGVNYPDTTHLASIQNPAQSWNSLTVGASTSKAWMQEERLEGWTPIAPKGRLSPASTTSITWEAQEWPLKLEIVRNQANVARRACTRDKPVQFPKQRGMPLFQARHFSPEVGAPGHCLLHHATRLFLREVPGQLGTQLFQAFPELHNRTWVPRPLRYQRPLLFDAVHGPMHGMVR